jgi:hypothetical protein
LFDFACIRAVDNKNVGAGIRQHFMTGGIIHRPPNNNRYIGYLCPPNSEPRLGAWAFPSKLWLNVRFGSLADIRAAKSHVRFTPESGHCLRRWLDKLATAHIGDRAIQSKSVRSVFARIFSRRNP